MVNSSRRSKLSLFTILLLGRVFAQVPDASQKQLDETVQSAHIALKTWGTTTANDRQAALETYADLLEAHADAFMSLLTREQGKPRAGAEWEVLGSVAWLRAVASQRLPDEVVEDTDERRVVTRFYASRRGRRYRAMEFSDLAGDMEDCTGVNVG